MDMDRKGTKTEKKKEKTIVKDENKERREQVFDRAKKVLDAVRKTDWKSRDYEPNPLDIEGEAELFQEEDEEENDYNILYDLNDYNKNAQPGIASKSAFKTKLFSKGRLKVKLK